MLSTVVHGTDVNGTVTAAPERWPGRVAALLIVAGVVRLVVWAALFQGRDPTIADELSYDGIARSLVVSGQFASDRPTSLRPPLYPAVVAGIYRIFGLHHYDAVRVCQSLLSLGTVVLAFLLGRELGGPRTGWWSAVFCAFYPSLLGAANLILTETQFTFLLTAGCLCVLRYLRTGRVTLIALAGLLLGLGALTRSVLWLFPGVMAPLLLLLPRQPLANRIRAVACFVTVFVAILVPWSIRNTRLHGTFLAVDSMGGRNLMMGNYEHTPLLRAWDAISLEGERSWWSVLRAADPDVVKLTEGQRDKRAMRYALGYVASHPVQSLQRWCVRTFQFWQLERELLAGARFGYFVAFSPLGFAALTVVVLASYVLAMLTGVMGVVKLCVEERSQMVFLLVVIGYVWGLHTLTFAHSRYHLPLMPLVLAFSAAAVTGGWHSFAQRRGFPVACGICVLLFAGWVWEGVRELETWRGGLEG